ncbi:MAG: right-handed parallel beta-helix repeat-containing protein, partial [Armatimonadota bacterium]
VEYDLEAPAEGDYNLFARYGADNEPWGYKDISGRVSVQVDGGARVPMEHVPDTGGWTKYLWASQPQATVHLTAGKHVLRWTSDLGPGMDLDAMALCDAPDWRPVGVPPAPPPAGKHLITIQNETYVRIHGDRSILSSAGYRGADDLYFDPGTLQEWPLSPDKMLHLWIFEDDGLCSNTLVPIKSLDERSGHLVTAEKLQDASTVGARFFVDNVREALDAPGEWYCDKATGVLTYWPKAPNFQSQRCVASDLQEIVRLAGDPSAKPATFVSYVNFENLTFEASAYGHQEQNWYHSEQAALDLRNVQHCRVRACSFVGMGCNAIACYAASTDNEFLGNEIGYPGGGGITLNSMTVNHYDGSCPSVCERNVVAGNHLHHCGQIFKHGAGVYLNSSSYNHVVNNYLHDTSRHPIIATYACGGNVISFNELQHSNLETGDCGAIHTYQTNYHPIGGNVIENNLIGDVVGRATTVDGKFLSPHYTWGIYLDGESWRTTVRNNVVYRNTGGGVMMNSGQDNVWENNIFVDARDKQIQYSNYS